MVRRGYITAAAADAAFAAPLLLGDDPDLVESPAPHFVPFAKAELARLLPGVALGRAGLVVATTLDLTAQQLAQQSVSDNVAALRDSRKLTNGALVALRPNSGEIVAMVGSTDFNATDFGGQVNVVLRVRWRRASSARPRCCGICRCNIPRIRGGSMCRATTMAPSGDRSPCAGRWPTA
jgi:peptidoglycan glycosyltransferase